MSARLDIPKGTRFGAWVVLGPAPPSPGGLTRLTVQCTSCGTTCDRDQADLVGGRSKRCILCHPGGTKRAPVAVGETPPELRAIWAQARSVVCPVCDRSGECLAVGVAGESFMWGVHRERAVAAECPMIPSVAEIDGAKAKKVA